MSGILCYKLRKKKEKKSVKPSPTSPPCSPGIPKLRSGEKIPNFKAPQAQTSPSSLINSLQSAPLSPGTVRVCRNLSHAPSTVSNGHGCKASTFSISPSPTPLVSGTPSIPLYPPQGLAQPPSRNSTYSPTASPIIPARESSRQTAEPSNQMLTYLDQLEEENRKLRNLIVNQTNLSLDKNANSPRGHSPMLYSTCNKIKKLDNSPNREVLEKM